MPPKPRSRRDLRRVFKTLSKQQDRWRKMGITMEQNQRRIQVRSERTATTENTEIARMHIGTRLTARKETVESGEET